jgi:Tol biopolymer transport system component
MRNDRFDVLERLAPLFLAPEPSFEGFLRRRDRKRRNQRIASGVVGIAVFVAAAAAVWIATSGGQFDRTQRPAVPGPSVTVPGAPEVDYLLDLNTGERTPLPEAIIRSQGDQGAVSPPGGYADSPDGSLLAYVGRTGNEGPLQIFITGIDGTGVRQMTHDPIGPAELAWSPDGRRIAYVARFSRGLFVLDVATGESTQITDEAHVEGPQFTPDGSSLLYTRGLTDRPMLRTVPVIGGKSTPLFRLSGDLRDAENGSLSPDGSLVTFISGQVDTGDLRGRRWVANTDGTDRRSLPNCALNPAGAWSPDGSRIVCVRFDSGPIVVIDVATRQMRQVASGGEGAIWLDDHTLLIDV